MYYFNMYPQQIIKTIKAVSWILLFTVLQTYACEPFTKNGVPILTFPPKFDSPHPDKDYIFQLVQLLLKKTTEKFGPCEARLLDHKLPLKRLEHYLQTGYLVDVAAFTVTKERDSKFLPVKIPISKGLMGYRLFIIHNEDIEKFSAVQNLSDLSQYMAGQGIGWADVKILERNHLPVLTTGSIKTLIDMLAYKRFDYFPRGALQITTEIEAYRNKPVIVEPSIVLSYPSMTALYVNTNNQKLAQRLEYGLKLAFADGSFDEFFNNHPSSVTALLNLNLKDRKIFTICNPILPAWVPINTAEYWLEAWPEEILKKDCK